MRTTGTIALYELLRMVRVKETFWLLLFLPTLLIFILGNALSGVMNPVDEVIDPIEVGVVYADTSNPEMTASMMESGEVSEWLNITEFASKEELLTALEERETAYGLIVPAGFAANVISGQAASWELYPGFNDSDNLLAQSVLGSMLDSINFTQSAVVALGTPEAMTLADKAQVSTPAEYVEVTRPDTTGKDYSAMQYYASAMLVMFLLYTGMATALSIVSEKERNTLDRLYAAPVKPIHILLGKMIGGGLIALCQAVIIIVFTNLVYGVEWGDRYFMLFLACIFVVAGSISLAVIVTAFTSSAKMVQTMFTVIIMAMTFLSGGFNPEIGDFLESLGRFTLSHWATQSFIHLILESPQDILGKHILTLGLIAGGLFAVSAMLGRKAVSR